MSDVSWHPNYSIDISNMDGVTVYHLGEALKAYMKKNATIDNDVSDCFNKTVEVCEHIVFEDDKD